MINSRTPSERSSSDVDLDQLFDAEWCKNPDLYHDYFDGVGPPASVDSDVSDHCACQSSHPTPEVTEPEENPAVAKQSEESADAPTAFEATIEMKLEIVQPQETVQASVPHEPTCGGIGSRGGVRGDSWDITSSEDEEETDMTQAALPPPQVVNQDLHSPVSTRSTAAPVTPVVSLVAYPAMSSTKKRAVERSRSPRFAKVVDVQKHAPSDIAWWTEPVEVVNRVGTTLHIRNRVTYKLEVVYVGFVCVAAANTTCISCALEPNCGDSTNNRFNIRIVQTRKGICSDMCVVAAGVLRLSYRKCGRVGMV
jgi:hypothetical protein